MAWYQVFLAVMVYVALCVGCAFWARSKGHHPILWGLCGLLGVPFLICLGNLRRLESPEKFEQSRVNSNAWAIFLVFCSLSLLVLGLIWPSFIRSWHGQMGRIAMADQEYATAAMHYQKLLNYIPNAKNHQLLGDCLVEVGQYEDALTHYKQAQEMNKKLNLDKEFGLCYAQQGKMDEAMPYLNKVLARNPGDPAANYFVGKQLIEEGKYAQAAKALAASSTDPRWNDAAAPLRQKIKTIVLGEAQPDSTEANPAS